MDYFDILLARNLANKGDITTESLSVTENGTYTAPSGKAYTPVTVSVQPPANSYQLKSITTPTSLATFNASEMPMPSLKVSVEAKQDLHGYDKPWVGGAGKNVAMAFRTTNGSVVGIPYTVDRVDDNIVSYTLNGTATSIGAFIPFKMPVTDSEKTYNVVYFETPIMEKFAWDNTDNVQINISNTITVPSNHEVFIGIYIYNGTVISNKKLKVMASESAITTFEPYSNECPISGWSEVNVSDTDDVDNPTVTQTTTISLGQTVYGGELDVVNGTSGNRLTDVIAEYNSSDGWVQTTQAYNNLYQANLPSLMPQTNPTSISTRCICNQAEVWETREGSAVAINHDVTLLSTGSLSVVMLKIDGTSLTDLDNYLRAHPLQIKYPLVTPTTFETQPTPIKSLNGTNNLSVDCGEVIEGEYFKALGGA